MPCRVATELASFALVNQVPGLKTTVGTEVGVGTGVGTGVGVEVEVRAGVGVGVGVGVGATPFHSSTIG